MLLERNAARVERFPEFRDWLNASAPDGAIERSPHGAGDVLVVNGIHLSSALDPEREVEVQVSHIAPGAQSIWLYGFGGGQLASRVLTRPALSELHCVGISRAATRALMSQVELPWLADSRVRLHAPTDAKRHYPGLVLPADLRLAEISPIRDALLFELAENAHQHTRGERREQRIRVARENRRAFPDPDVARLFGSIESIAQTAWAAVLAGGPSLTASLDYLRDRRSEFAIIAVSTVLAPLEKRGICPDFTVMVDPRPELGRHLDVLESLEWLASVPLVYGSDLAPDLLRRWPGPRYASHLSLPGVDELCNESPLATLFCSGTVAHTAVDLAVRLGARDVLLSGADFAFPGGRSHADGTAYARAVSGPRVPVESVSGDLIETDINLLGYLRDLEAYIEAHSEVRFWNASRVGAAIRGARAFRPEGASA